MGDQTVRSYINAREDPFMEEEPLAGATDDERFLDVKLRNLRLDVIPKEGESLRQLRWGPLVFLDSLAFLNSSLARIIDEHKEGNKENLAAGFPITMRHHPLIVRSEMPLIDLDLLTQKLLFPYRSLVDESSWDLPAVEPIERYYNDLRDEACDEETYERHKSIVARFGLRTLQDVHDAYLPNDVLLYADCFEAFRDAFHETSGIDPAHFMTLPSAAEKVVQLNLLKRNGADFGPELITDREFMERVLANIRGGTVCAFVAHARANHPSAAWYDPNETESRIAYTDKTSLYAEAMSKPLPFSVYEKR
jgi:hypothetical protein